MTRPTTSTAETQTAMTDPVYLALLEAAPRPMAAIDCAALADRSEELGLAALAAYWRFLYAQKKAGRG